MLSTVRLSRTRTSGRSQRQEQCERVCKVTDREILIWIHQRLVKVHGESPYVDYMHALRDVIDGLPLDKKSRSDVVTMNSTRVLEEIEFMELVKQK